MGGKGIKTNPDHQRRMKAALREKAMKRKRFWKACMMQWQVRSVTRERLGKSDQFVRVGCSGHAFCSERHRGPTPVGPYLRPSKDCVSNAVAS